MFEICLKISYLYVASNWNEVTGIINGTNTVSLIVMLKCVSRSLHQSETRGDFAMIDTFFNAFHMFLSLQDHSCVTLMWRKGYLSRWHRELLHFKPMPFDIFPIIVTVKTKILPPEISSF